MRSQRYRPFFVIAISLLIFVGCQRVPPTVIPTATAVATLTPEVILADEDQFAETSPQPDVTRASLNPTTTDQTASSTDAAPIERISQVCSPLEIHSLEDLRLITSDPYRPPPPGSDERHQGIDFSYYRWKERIGIQGVGVQAILPGKVAASLQDSYPFGNLVIVETPASWLPESFVEQAKIQTGESLYILYAHLESAPLVSLGEAVKSCQLIGRVGKSGNAVEPHLHIETRWGPAGSVFEGMAYYRPEATDEEKQNYLLWRTSGVYRHFDPMLLLRWKE